MYIKMYLKGDGVRMWTGFSIQWQAVLDTVMTLVFHRRMGISSLA
jgi:hypothetical protein